MKLMPPEPSGPATGTTIAKARLRGCGGRGGETQRRRRQRHQRSRRTPEPRGPRTQEPNCQGQKTHMTKWRASHAWMTAVDVYESLSHTLIRPWLRRSMNELVSR